MFNKTKEFIDKQKDGTKIAMIIGSEFIIMGIIYIIHKWQVS